MHGIVTRVRVRQNSKERSDPSAHATTRTRHTASARNLNVDLRHWQGTKHVCVRCTHFLCRRHTVEAHDQKRCATGATSSPRDHLLSKQPQRPPPRPPPIAVPSAAAGRTCVRHTCVCHTRSGRTGLVEFAQQGEERPKAAVWWVLHAEMGMRYAARGCVRCGRGAVLLEPQCVAESWRSTNRNYQTMDFDH